MVVKNNNKPAEPAMPLITNHFLLLPQTDIF